MAKKDKAAEGGEKKSKKKLIIIVVVLLVAAAGAKFTILAPKSKAACAAPAAAGVAGVPGAVPAAATVATVPPTTAAPAPGVAGVATTTTTVCVPAPPPPGSVLKLDSTTINLADGRYLKVGLALQLAASADLKTFTADDGGAKALDLAIKLLGSKGYNDLISVKSRDAVQTALSQQVAAAYENKVLGVYFTEFVMQ
jgi:flagellar protein FliL